MVVLSFTIKCRIIQRARVHKSLYILVAGPPSLHTHFSVWDMAREGEPKITFCAFSLRTRLRARRFAAVALSSAGVAGCSADVAVGFVMIGRLTQMWNCRVQGMDRCTWFSFAFIKFWIFWMSFKKIFVITLLINVSNFSEHFQAYVVDADLESYTIV